MKINTLAIACVFLASCGGGGSSDMPVDDAVDAGDLANLFGLATFAYTFTGTESSFVTTATFSPSGVDGSVIRSTASTRFRLTSQEPFMSGLDFAIVCNHVSQTDQLLCVLDAGGDAESIFLFDEFARISQGAILGAFEFCESVDPLACPSDVVTSPDGIVGLVVTTGEAQALATEGRASQAPYMQYLDQGSAQ